MARLRWVLTYPHSKRRLAVHFLVCHPLLRTRHHVTHSHRRPAQERPSPDACREGEAPTPSAVSTGQRDVVGGIRGWRGWRLVHHFGQARLQSISAPDLWESPVFVAH